MAAITPSRVEFFQEETRYRSAVSEALLTKVGAQSNFVNERQYDSHAWHMNGPYSLFGNAQGIDGVFPCLFDIELVGYILYNGEGGTAGTSTLDIHRLTGGDTDAGTIFTINPSVTSSATDGSYSFVRLDPASDLSIPTGHTKAFFNTTSFDEGDALRLDIDSAMTGASNLNFQLMFRPR